MESLLSIVCILFFSILTYSIISGHNLQKNHKNTCRKILIAEDMDMLTILNYISGMSVDQLKKRCQQLGATELFLNSTNDPIELKLFILKNTDTGTIIPSGEAELEEYESQISTRTISEEPTQLEPIIITDEDVSYKIELLGEEYN